MKLIPFFFVALRDVEDIWKDHFDYFYREYGKSHLDSQDRRDQKLMNRVLQMSSSFR